jgi:hypothetical protein
LDQRELREQLVQLDLLVWQDYKVQLALQVPQVPLVSAQQDRLVPQV